MILNEVKKDVVVSDSFKTSGFKIQASAKAFEILSSNIYSNKVRAVIRELSCNAYDAHVSVGNTDSFKVHLPTWVEPHFSVRDFGPGLSDDSIREIYTTYFFSSKTNSNDYIGALGLGSKSPFSIVDSFTVTSFHGGKKNVYSCFKDENGEPQIAHLSSEESDEPCGVEVSLCVDKYMEKEFHREAIETYQWFDKIPEINVDSLVEQINKAKNRFTIKKETYGMVREGYGGKLYAIMGNVAYEVESQYSISYHCTYIKFNIGELSFDPGRENLSYDQKTKKAIQEKVEYVKDNFHQDVIKSLQEEPNSFKRSLMAVNYQGTMGLHQNEDFVCYLPVRMKSSFTYYVRGSRGTGKYTSNMFNEEMDVFKYTKGYEQRLKQHVKSQSSKYKAAVLTEEQIKELNVPADMVKDMTTLPKLVRAKAASRSVDDTIYSLDNDGRRHAVGSCPTTEKVYLKTIRGTVEINGIQISDCNANKIAKVLRKQGVEFELYIVKTPTSKKSWFKKDNWVPFEDFLLKNLDKTKLKLYNEGSSFDEVEIDDVARLCENSVFDSFLDMLAQNEDSYAVKNIINLFPEIQVEKSDELIKENDRLIAKYPMLTLVRSWSIDKKIVNDYIALVDSSN